MTLPSAEGTAWLRELLHAILETQSGIFTVLGIWLGAWLSQRSELTRLRVERRTQIFDEACRVTAESSLKFGALTLGTTTIIFEPDPLKISLDRKIETTFSRSAYKAWRAVYNFHRTMDPDAIHALVEETRAARSTPPPRKDDYVIGWSDEIKFPDFTYADAQRTLEKDAFDEATRVALTALAKELK